MALSSKTSALVLGAVLWALYGFNTLVIIRCVADWLVVGDRLAMSDRLVYLVVDSLHTLTEPVLGPLRQVLPNGGLIPMNTPGHYLDWSPVALAGIFFVLLRAIDMVLLRRQKG